MEDKFLNKFNSFLQFFLHKTNIKLSRLATISLLEAQSGICAEAGFIRRIELSRIVELIASRRRAALSAGGEGK